MKEYSPVPMIRSGRFCKLYDTGSEDFKSKIEKRLKKYIDECPYKDDKNYGHLCNLLTCMAVYETLQEFGKSKEESIEIIKAEMYACVEPARIQNEKDALQDGYIERLKVQHPIEISETYGSGWDVEFPACNDDEFIMKVNTCIYNETFKRYHYPELGPLFCHVDEIMNGNLEKIDFSYTGQLCVNQKPCDYTFRYRQKGDLSK